jgi:hypothetical protein
VGFCSSAKKMKRNGAIDYHRQWKRLFSRSFPQDKVHLQMFHRRGKAKEKERIVNSVKALQKCNLFLLRKTSLCKAAEMMFENKVSNFQADRAFRCISRISFLDLNLPFGLNTLEILKNRAFPKIFD